MDGRLTVPTGSSDEPLTAPTLTAREREVLRAWIRADTTIAASRVLFVSPTTVNTHLARIRKKYDGAGRPARTKVQLTVRALQDRLVDLSEL